MSLKKTCILHNNLSLQVNDLSLFSEQGSEGLIIDTIQSTWYCRQS